MTPTRKAAPAQDELLKGTLDMLVLRTLTVQSMHGYAIVRHIERLSGGVFNIEHGSLYPALERLQKNGLVVGKWGESPTGRRGRYYTITAAGRHRLGAEFSTFDTVLAALAGLMTAVWSGRRRPDDVSPCGAAPSNPDVVQAGDLRAGAAGGDPLSSRARHQGPGDRSTGRAQRGDLRRTTTIRQCHTLLRGDTRDERIRVLRHAAPGCALRAPHVSPVERLHDCCRDDDCARHRGDGGNLQRRGRAHSEAAAVSGGGARRDGLDGQSQACPARRRAFLSEPDGPQGAKPVAVTPQCVSRGRVQPHRYWGAGAGDRGCHVCRGVVRPERAPDRRATVHR